MISRPGICMYSGTVFHGKEDILAGASGKRIGAEYGREQVFTV